MIVWLILTLLIKETKFPNGLFSHITHNYPLIDGDGEIWVIVLFRRFFLHLYHEINSQNQLKITTVFPLIILLRQSKFSEKAARIKITFLIKYVRTKKWPILDLENVEFSNNKLKYNEKVYSTGKGSTTWVVKLPISDTFTIKVCLRDPNSTAYCRRLFGFFFDLESGCQCYF